MIHYLRGMVTMTLTAALYWKPEALATRYLFRIILPFMLQRER